MTQLDRIEREIQSAKGLLEAGLFIVAMVLTVILWRVW